LVLTPDEGSVILRLTDKYHRQARLIGLALGPFLDIITRSETGP
jgi:hypothetical protein